MKRKLLAVILALTMVVGLLPAVAAADEVEGGEPLPVITAFAELSETSFDVAAGTEYAQITAGLEEDYPAVTATVDGVETQIAVSWSSADYQADVAGSYLFTAQNASEVAYVLADGVQWPQVSVAVTGVAPVAVDSNGYMEFPAAGQNLMLANSPGNMASNKYKLTDNYTLNLDTSASSIRGQESSLTWDLNGYTLTITGDGLQVQNGKKLVIEDSSSNQTGEVVFENHSVAWNCSLFVASNSSFEMTGGTLVGPETGTLLKVTGTSTAAISGGTVSSAKPFDVATVNSTLTITGGTFSADVNDYCADGYTLVDNNDGTYTVTKSGGYVAEVNGESCETLVEALTKAVTETAAGKTVNMKLLADVTGTEGQYIDIPEGMTVVLDLNGFALIGVNGDSFIKNHGDLTINDSSNGSGRIYTTNTDAQSRHAIENYGALTINGGTFGDSDTDRTNANSVQRGNALRNFGTATINGGYFTACDNYTNGGYAYAIANSTGTLTIENATVYGNINGLVAADGGTLTVKGGTYTLGNGVADNLWRMVYTSGSGVVNVQGGTFTKNAAGTNRGFFGGNGGTVNVSGGIFEDQVNGTIYVDSGTVTVTDGDFKNGISKADTATVAVSGGTFGAAVPEDCCATGYKPVEKGNGAYGVQQATESVQVWSGSSLKGTYSSLKAAFDAVPENGYTVKLMSSVTVNGELALPDLTHTGVPWPDFYLDLNGYDIYGSGKLVIPAEMYLQLWDKAGNGNVYPEIVKNSAADSSTEGMTEILGGTFHSQITNNSSTKIELHGGTFEAKIIGTVKAYEAGSRFAVGAGYTVENVPAAPTGYAAVQEGNYIVYGAVTYTIVLHLNGGTLAEGAVQGGISNENDNTVTFSHTYNGEWNYKVTVPVKTDCTRENHTFSGWYKTEDFTGSIAASSTKGYIYERDIATYADEDDTLHLYAKWTAQPVAQVISAASTTNYTSLADAVAAAQSGDTIKLLKDVVLADDTSVKIEGKGSADAPVTIDLNGCTISGNNSKSSASASAAVNSGILTVCGSYVVLTDTSAGEKGGLTNTNTTSSSTSVVTVLPSGTQSGQLTVSGGVVLENQSSNSNSKGIRVQTSASSQASAEVIVEDAYIKSYAYVVDAPKNDTASAVINGGTFEVRGNAPVTVNADITVNGGTFIGGRLYHYLDRIGEGKVAILTKNDSGVYVVTVVEENGADYTARLAGTSLCVVGDLYIFQDIGKLEGKTIQVVKDASLTFPDGAFFGKESGISTTLTLELANGATISGRVPMALADITVTGGTVAEGMFAPVDPGVYQMLSDGENGLYSCGLANAVVQITYTSGKVATYYDAETAIKAISNAYNVQEFKLLQSISTAMQVSEGNSNVTINLNGFIYTYTGDNVAFVPYNNRTLTITNGILECSSESKGVAVQIGNPGKKPTAGNLIIRSDATVKGTVLLSEGTLDMYGTVDTTAFAESGAIMGNGEANNGTTINIYDGAVVTGADTAVAIYHPQNGTLNISGGTIIGGDGIYMKSGILNITGGTITGNGEKAEYSHNGNGYNVTGDALVLDNCGYPGGVPAANISGGDFKSVNAAPVGSYAYGDDLTPLTGFITGGYYEPGIDGAYVAEGYGAVYSDKAGYTHMIGEEYTATFVVTPSNATIKVTDIQGNEVPANEDGTYTLNKAGSYTYTISAPGYSDKRGSIAAGENEDQEISVTLNKSSGGNGGGSVTTYPVAVEDVARGTLKADHSRASKGSTVTITVKPDSGYVLNRLTVTDANGKTVKLTRKSSTEYTFTMPASKVTVTASFVPAATFTDVSARAYYYDAVAWAVENGITNGTGNGKFSPDLGCTRAQAVTFLWRAAGCPAPKSSVNPFTDVQRGEYYYEAVLWAVEQGITIGTSATTFSPDEVCTRAHIVTFLWRSAGQPAASAAYSFADVDRNAYYADAVVWAVRNDITNGTGNGKFSPNEPCTRAQIVTFLYRAYAN